MDDVGRAFNDCKLGMMFLMSCGEDRGKECVQVGAIMRLRREALEQRWIGCLTSQEWIDEARKLVGEVTP
jgi:hypothetical protein